MRFPKTLSGNARQIFCAHKGRFASSCNPLATRPEPSKTKSPKFPWGFLAFNPNYFGAVTGVGLATGFVIAPLGTVGAECAGWVATGPLTAG